ncbi:MAG: hypothetical protein ACI4OT_00925 [Bacilli bacterium]
MKEKTQKEKLILGDTIIGDDVQLAYELKEQQEEFMNNFYQKLNDLKQVFTPSEWYLIATSFGLEGYGQQSAEDVAKTFNCHRTDIDENIKKLQKKLQSPECREIMKNLNK